MSVSYFVRYQGEAEDPGGFVDYYRGKHAAILKQFPGIQALTLHTPAEWTDPYPVNLGGVCLLAQMVFESPRELDAALRSPARAQAREDFARFPSFQGEVFHQAMHQESIF